MNAGAKQIKRNKSPQGVSWLSVHFVIWSARRNANEVQVRMSVCLTVVPILWQFCGSQAAPMGSVTIKHTNNNGAFSTKQQPNPCPHHTPSLEQAARRWINNMNGFVQRACHSIHLFVHFCVGGNVLTAYPFRGIRIKFTVWCYG